MATLIKLIAENAESNQVIPRIRDSLKEQRSPKVTVGTAIKLFKSALSGSFGLYEAIDRSESLQQIGENVV